MTLRKHRLDLHIKIRTGLESYYTGNVDAALSHLKKIDRYDRGMRITLSGPTKSGKSHAAAIFSEILQAAGWQVNHLGFPAHEPPLFIPALGRADIIEIQTL